MAPVLTSKKSLQLAQKIVIHNLGEEKKLN